MSSDIEAYFEKQDTPVKAIALAMRERVETLGPHLICKLAWGFPCWSGHERIISVIAHSSRCNLQLFYGAALAPKFARIEGTGKSLRHVKVHSLADVDGGLDDIIGAAISLDATDPQRVR
ncbi:MAG: DUF5655 domain-containing protein [Pseudomonadota bacterium]